MERRTKGWRYGWKIVDGYMGGRVDSVIYEKIQKK